MSNSIYKSEPELIDLLDIVQKRVKIEINCHAIAVIESFDTETQTAQASIVYKKVFMNSDGTTSLKPYPVLVDVPVICLSGGTASMRFPIAQGDVAMVYFNDRDIDTYITSGNAGAQPYSARLHSFSDGVALVGIHPFSASLQNYDPARYELVNANMVVSLGTEKLRVKNEAQSLADLLQQLITQCKAVATAASNITVLAGGLAAPNGPVTGTSGKPVNASDFSSAASQLGTIATNLQGLLE